MDRSLLFEKSYDAYRLVADLVDQFPKKDRHSLGQRLEVTTLEVLENVIMTEATISTLKDAALLRVTVKADVCAVLVRLTLDRKLIHETNYFILIGLFAEIAKMANGWRKSLGR